MSNRITDIPDLVHAWEYENLILAGQPGERAWGALKSRGVNQVINIRSAHEADFSKDKESAENQGMSYHEVPLMFDGKISKDAAKKISEIVESAGDEKLVVHCGTANRVAGWLMVHLAQKGMAFEDSVKIAQKSGLSNPGFIEQAQDILES